MPQTVGPVLADRTSRPSALGIQDSVVMGNVQQTVAGPPAARNPAVSQRLNVQDSVLMGNIDQSVHQTINYGGVEYALDSFPDPSPSMFPARKAQGKDGRTLVTKHLGSFDYAEEINKDIRRLQLHNLPRGATAYRECMRIEGQVYLVRDFHPGTSLRVLLNGQKQLDDQKTMHIVGGVMGLLRLTSMPHGALCPGNIFLRGEQEVGLGDWGINLLKERVADYDGRFRQSLEAHRKTNPYCSCLGEPLPPTECDAYAMGGLICEMFGLDVSRFSTNPPDPAWLRETLAARTKLPGLPRVIEDVLARRVKFRDQLFYRLGEIAMARRAG